MDNNFIIVLILVMAINAVWFSAKFFIRKNGLKSYMLWYHFQDFVSLYKLSSKKYSADVNKKAKLYLIGIPFLIITMLVLFIMPTISKSSQYSQKFDFHAAWLKEQIDEDYARSIIEANIEDVESGDWVIVEFPKGVRGKKKYDANGVSYVDTWNSTNYEEKAADFFGKVGTIGELWTFEVDQDSLEHVAYINGIILLRDDKPAIAIGLTINDKIAIPDRWKPCPKK